MAENTQIGPVPLESMTTYTAPLHQSSFNCWLSCKRKFLFEHRLRLFPKRKPFLPSATLGTFIHSILAHGETTALSTLKSNLSALSREVLEGRDEFGDIQKRIDSMGDLWSKARVVVAILHESFPPSPLHKKIFAEQYLTASLTLPSGQSLCIGGTLDKVIRNEPDGTFWIRDYKSSSMDALYVLTGYRWSSQLWFYKLLFELTQSKPCRGFILDFIQTPTIKMCSKDKDPETGEISFDRYLGRCREWYKTNRDSACRSFVEMFPHSLYRSIPPDIYQSLFNFSWQQPSEINPDLWPRDMSCSACKAFFRTCDYYPLCSIDKAAWPTLIENEYVVIPPEDSVSATIVEE